jgi:glycosyltransferase involved in cell wall biosynthesis
VAFGSASLPAVAKSLNLDVVHDLTGLAPIARGAGPAAVVVTIHDLISRVGLSSNDHVDNLIQRHWLQRALRQADAVVSVSAATSRDVERYLAVPDDRLHVVPHGVAEQFCPRSEDEVASVLERYEVSRPYVLTVGASAARKNVRRLRAAFGAIRPQFPDLSLVVTGKGELTPSTVDVSHNDVVRTGYVNQDDLPALYSGATVFAFPSLYEGFGLPVLEAMACGTPTLCGDNSSLPEVAGDAAVVVDVSSVDAIARGLREILSDERLREELSERGLARASTFTWRGCAEQTLDVYRAAVLRRTHRSVSGGLGGRAQGCAD